MNGRKRNRTLKRTMYSIQKRFLAFLLAAAMILTNIGADINTVFAASSSEAVVFSMSGSELVDAIEEAIANENEVKAEDLDFTNGKIAEFKKLFWGKGKIYEVFPDLEGNGIDAELRVFVRLPENADDMYAVTGDEEIIFLYVNNGYDTISCTTKITRMDDGVEKVKRTPRITVKAYEAAFGDEEVNVISKPAQTSAPKDTTIPAESETQAEIPEETIKAPEETQAEIPEETAAAAPEETQTEIPEETKIPPEETQAEIPEETAAEPEETQAEIPEETAAALEETQEEPNEDAAELEKKDSEVKSIEPVATIIRHFAPVVTANESGDGAEEEQNNALAPIKEDKVQETAEPVIEKASEIAEPTETAEPTTVAEPTEAAEPTTAAESTTAAEPTEAAEPTKAAEPTEAAEPAEPAEPAEAAEPTEAPADNKTTAPDKKDTLPAPAKSTPSEASPSESIPSAGTPDLKDDISEAGSNDLVGIGYCSTAKAYVTTINQLKALDDYEGYKISYYIDPEASARIVEGPRGVEEGYELTFGVKNQIGYEIQNVTANGENLIADSTTDEEDETQTVWYHVPEVYEDQEIEVNMAETGDHPEFNAQLVMEDGTIIHLHAPKGVLPAGVKAAASVVTGIEDTVKENVEDQAAAEGENKEVISSLSYNIDLLDSTGKKLDDQIWNGAVEVTFTGATIKQHSKGADTVEVMYVATTKEEKPQEKITPEDVLSIEPVSETLNVTDEQGIGEVAFEAEHFSTYTVVFGNSSSSRRLNVEVKNTNGESIGKGGYSIILNSGEETVSKIAEKIIASDTSLSDYDFVTAKVGSETALSMRWNIVFGLQYQEDDFWGNFFWTNIGNKTVTFLFETPYATFDANGGSGGPTNQTIKNGTLSLPLPEDVGIHAPAGEIFIGWSKQKDGQGSNYVAEYQLTGIENKTRYYAIWLNPSAHGSHNAYFYVRTGDTIFFEPSSYNQKNFYPKSGAENSDNRGKIREYIAVNNNLDNVKSNILTTPTDAKWEQIIRKDGGSFNKNTQTIVWYVIKKQGGGSWHVDGVIRDKETYQVTYHPNNGNEQIPGTKAYTAGSKVTVDFNTTPSRLGYTFAGWDTNKAALPNRVLYPVSSSHPIQFTMPNETIDLYAIWRPDSETPYQVEYYYEKDGAYGAAESSNTRSAMTGSTVEVTESDKTPKHADYVFDEGAENVLSGSVAGDGTLTLKVHFKQQFSVTYKPGSHGTFVAQTTEKLNYGAPTPDFKGDKTGDPGYHFKGWYPSVAETVTKQAEYVAQWDANKNTPYMVTYYYEEKGSYSEAPYKTDRRFSTTGTTAEVTTDDTKPKQAGYAFDAAAENVLSGSIAGDGSLILKVYFKQQFTVTYKKGAHGTFKDQTFKDLGYNVNTPEFKGIKTGDPGYEFKCWKPMVASNVTDNAVYEAQWIASNRSYKVEYYYQKNGSYSDTTDRSVTRSGTTGSTVEVTDADKKPAETGYVYDFTAGNVLKGTITGDGTLVLKVYFKQQFTVIYKPGSQGTFAEQKKEHLSYGADTPRFYWWPSGKAGYSFDGWTPEVAEKVTDNAEYVAKWKAKTDTPYTVEYYYQKAGEYSWKEDYKTVRRGTTDTEAEVTYADKSPTKAGYVFDSTARNVLSGTIQGDGKLVLKVYFKQQFTVTYKPGSQGTFAEQKTEHLSYGADTPDLHRWPTGKTGYSFDGWEPRVAKKVTDNAEYVAKWKAKTDTPYTVAYYYQKAGNYSWIADERTSRAGTTDTIAEVTDADKSPTKDGYVFDRTARNVLNGTITGDGKLVLKVYFKQQFTVTYKPGSQGTFAEQKTEHLSYGVVTPRFYWRPTGKAGYSFDGWAPDVAKKVTDNAEYVAQWKANSDTPYKVEYYYQKAGKYSWIADDKTVRKGTTDTKAEVTNADKTPTKTGYVFDSTARNVLEGTIRGDGRLVLKVYFKQQFTVTYKPGIQGTFTEQKTEHLNYGANTPGFHRRPTGNAGYTFAGWEPRIAKRVTDNAEYVAKWIANENTAYKVEYYYQEEGIYDTTTEDKTVRRGTTDTEAEATDADKTSKRAGYVFDEGAENQLSGIIAGDESLVLKVYFKQQFAVTYKKGAHGTFEDQTVGDLDYNTKTPEFDGTIEGEPGYEFEGWNPEVAENVTDTAEYVAQWKASENTAYKVAYYYQEGGAYTTADSSIDQSGTTDTTAEVTDADKTPTKTGYVFDGDAENVLSGNIAGDGSLVLKVYFKQQLAVTYKKGTHGTFEDQTVEGLDYHAETPEFEGTKTGESGYEFAGWNPLITPLVTETITYEAQWIPSDSTKYSVDFYYESKGNYPEQPNNSSLRAGTTDVLTAVTDADKTAPEGYVFDSNAANVLEAAVTGNGEMILKVYFKQQFTITYNPGEHGSFDSQIKTGLSYGDKIPVFGGQTTASGNYRFRGWDKELADTVTESAVYTALWSYNGGGSSGGGGGGSSSGGGPNTSRPHTSGGPGDTTVIIEPEPVPLANLPEDNGVMSLILIDDGNIPLARLPKTGEKEPLQGVAAIVSGLLLAAYMVISRKKRES